MKRFKSKKGVALLVTLVVIAASAIGAFAYYSTGGSGSGSATVGSVSSSGIVINLTATITSGLIPGGNEPISFSATNASGTSDGYVGTISLSTPVSVTDVTIPTPNAGCASYLSGHQGDFTLSGASVTAGAVTEDKVVPHGGASTPMPNGATLNWANSAADQTGCAGETLNVALSST